jgi:hypothetical protein
MRDGAEECSHVELVENATHYFVLSDLRSAPSEELTQVPKKEEAVEPAKT